MAVKRERESPGKGRARETSGLAELLEQAWRWLRVWGEVKVLLQHGRVSVQPPREP